MSGRIKYFCLVIAAQTGCLAAGLWMQNRYISSSMRQVTEDRVWADLRAAGETLLTAVGDEEADGRTVGATQVEAASKLLGSVLLAGGPHMTLVDSNWLVVTHAGVPEGEPGNALSVGQRVHLADFRQRPSVELSGRAGTLTMPDGEHIALAFALPDQTGYLLIHESLAGIRSRSDAHLQYLPGVGAMTLAWTAALLGVTLYMMLSRGHEQRENERAKSDSQALRRIETLVRTRDAVIFGLAKLADSRDPDTGDHLERISLYSSTLASALRRLPKHGKLVTPNFVRTIGISSVLHDIGKVGIEDRILGKPGPLTDSERARMQEHSVIGGECLRDIEQRLGSSNFLQMAREIAFAHHERWDGTGYPHGIAGEDIPLSARIVAIVDVFDALASKRVYKPAFPYERCVQIIREGAGSQFDPDLVEVWLEHAGRFRAIMRRFADQAAPATNRGDGAASQDAPTEQCQPESTCRKC